MPTSSHRNPPGHRTRTGLWRVTAAAGVLAVAAPLAAQVPESPEAAIGAMLEATRAQDWEGMAALMHPAALDEFVTIFAPVFEHQQGAEVREFLLGVFSIDEYRALRPADVFGAVMRFAMTQDPTMVATLQSAEVEIVGTLQEGADTAHVVYRMSMMVEDIPVTLMDVGSFAAYEGGWLALLKGDLRAFGAGIRAALDESMPEP